MNRKNIRSLIGILMLAGTLVAACHGGGGGGGGGDAPTTPAAPAAFSLLGPDNNSTGISFTPTFSWQAATGTTSFDLQIATDASFVSVVYENNALAATTTSFVLPAAASLNPGAMYYWRVIAINTAGQTIASNAPWSFTTGIVTSSAFSLSTPASGTQDVSLTPVLAWSASAGAVSYTVKIATDAAMNTVVHTSASINAATTQYSVPASTLSYFTAYYWQVTATNMVGSTAASNGPFNFKTKQVNAPSAFDLYSPSDNTATADLTPNLAWNPSPGATTYTLQIALDTAFTVMKYQQTGIAGTNWSVPSGNLNDASKYYWRVKAVNAGGATYSNSTRSFTTPVVHAPATFSLSYPLNAVNSSLTPTFTWQSSSLETSYTLDIGTDPTFNTGIIYTNSSLLAGTTSFTYPSNATALTIGTTYYWRVIAHNLTTTGPLQTPASNAPGQFTTAVVPPGSFSLTSPVNNATNVSITPVLNWTASAGTATYLVTISTNTGIVQTSPTITAPVTSYASPTLAGLTSYTWNVTAYNAAGWLSSSGTYSFTTRNILAPGSFDLTFPGNNAPYVSVTPNLSWSAAPGAVNYTAQLFSNITMTNLVSQASVSDPTTSVTLSTLNEWTTYYWNVVASNANGQATSNSNWFFTTQATTAPSAFDLSSPANNNTGVLLPPTLSWTSALRSNSYLVQVTNASDPGFASPIVSSTISGAAQLSPPATSYPLNVTALQAGTQYLWRVTANNNTVLPKPSTTPYFTFTTINSGASVTSIADNPSAGFDEILGMAKDASALYAVGYDSSAGYAGWRIEKRNLSDGTLVNAFGSGGVISNVTTTRSVAKAVAVSNPYLYVVGYDTYTPYKEWRIEKRDLVTGASVTTFGVSGVVTSGTTTAVATAIAVDSGYLYIAGYDSLTNPTRDFEWRIEKRDLATGATTTFGAGGVVVEHAGVSGGDDIPYGIAVDANGIYIVGSDTVAGKLTPGWRIEKRNLITGATITYISEGLTTTAEFDEALGIAIDANYMYVVGYDSQTPLLDDEWRIEKRNLSDLSFASFGTPSTPWIIQENPSSSSFTANDDAHTIALDANYMYIAGFDSASSFGNPEWRLEKRGLTYGSLIAAFGAQFGTPGFVNSNTSGGTLVDSQAEAIVADENYVYVGGFFPLSSTNDEWLIEKRAK